MVFVNAGAQELGEGSSDCFLPAADENRFSQFGLSQVCRLAENRSRVVLLSLEHNALDRTAAEKNTEERFAGMPQMKLEEHSLQNEKKEANYEKILFPAGAAGGV